ncbi:PD40 domain-containing protein [Flagellimonas allohymeniacidonis]|uniref:PD40 domain-containing protein n=1 Tax=Flagellimonas allohymeniacidonis TaxID=2517819 RepID=UPI0013EECE5C|nr:PD40 domain-containing protein [Allomuricauda hymeniacidonis]
MYKVSILIAVVLFQANWALGQHKAVWVERCLTETTHEDRYASYSPNGEWIVFESNRDGNWDIYMMNSQGENVKRLTYNESEDRRPSWHPNGEKVLFESNRNGSNELFTLNLRSGKEKKLKQNTKDGEFVFASYSPNGKRIAVSLRESEQKSKIVLLSKKGKRVKTIIENGKRNFYPRWSKDGKEIVYFSRKDTDNKDDEIYGINLETGVEARLTLWKTHNFCPSWSFDNSQIVYVTSMEGSRPEIFIMDRDGNNKTQITHNEEGDTLPNWHPKENRILVTAYRNGNYQICELELSEK